MPSRLIIAVESVVAEIFRLESVVWLSSTCGSKADTRSTETSGRRKMGEVYTSMTIEVRSRKFCQRLPDTHFSRNQSLTRRKTLREAREDLTQGGVKKISRWTSRPQIDREKHCYYIRVAPRAAKKKTMKTSAIRAPRRVLSPVELNDMSSQIFHDDVGAGSYPTNLELCGTPTRS